MHKLHLMLIVQNGPFGYQQTLLISAVFFCYRKTKQQHRNRQQITATHFIMITVSISSTVQYSTVAVHEVKHSVLTLKAVLLKTQCPCNSYFSLTQFNSRA